jgi:hypothetical protein
VGAVAAMLQTKHLATGIAREGKKVCGSRADIRGALLEAFYVEHSAESGAVLRRATPSSHLVCHNPVVSNVLQCPLQDQRVSVIKSAHGGAHHRVSAGRAMAFVRWRMHCIMPQRSLRGTGRLPAGSCDSKTRIIHPLKRNGEAQLHLFL